MRRHLVCSDLHGQKSIYDKLMKGIGNKKYTLYFLGDAVDRGECGYELMKELMANPNVVYIKGNHEDMFADSAREFLSVLDRIGHGDINRLIDTCGSIENVFYSGSYMVAHVLNGGEPTMRAWIKDGCPVDIIDDIEMLPVRASYKKFDMCHAGCSIKDYDAGNSAQMIWNRSHFYESWKNGRTLLFGHTPTPLLKGYDIPESEYKYSLPSIFGEVKNGRKIDLDCGAFFTNRFAVYDMDTDKYTIIENN